LLPIISVILEVSWLVSSRLFDFSVWEGVRISVSDWFGISISYEVWKSVSDSFGISVSYEVGISVSWSWQI
jgi:hypothetical protein